MLTQRSLQHGAKRSCSRRRSGKPGSSFLQRRRNGDAYGNRDRTCQFCTDEGLIETPLHFIMYCKKFENLRASLYRKIKDDISADGYKIFMNLSELIQFYILLGLDFPFIDIDILNLRKNACVYIHKMYIKRYKEL